MAIIDDVIAWAANLPAWQADAVRRLLSEGGQELNEHSYAEVLELAKVHLKLTPEREGLQAPLPPQSGQFSGAPVTAKNLRLIEIRDVENVNAIASGQTQVFAEKGVTVIYGENGSGKSGYARILKLACQARDKEEVILPDVFGGSVTGAPSATLKIAENGVEREVRWTFGERPDPILTNICVFDSRCARVITDQRNEVFYLPYGADIFERLVAVVLKVKGALEAEIKIQTPIQDSSVTNGTSAWNFLQRLSADTKDAEIKATTNWVEEDEKQLLALEELVRSSRQSVLAQELERLVRFRGRVTAAIGGVTALELAAATLTDEAIGKALTELRAAIGAHEIARTERRSIEPLAGIGASTEWELLYRAAKEYSEKIAYPGVEFPNTVEALCVLCQQPLSQEASARFKRFKTFMEDATSRVLAEKREVVRSLKNAVELLSPLAGDALDAVCEEVGAASTQAGQLLREFHLGVARRRQELIGALLAEGVEQSKNEWSAWPASPVDSLIALKSVLEAKHAEISGAAKPDEAAKLAARLGELRSRKALSARRVDIQNYIAVARRNAVLRAAGSSLRTQEITRQGTTLIRKNLTPELLGALQTELAALGATRIPVSIKPIGADGETAHEMLLEGAKLSGRSRMSQILSEGEARVIGIAGFLAELEIAPHVNTIVFDDPASSLDHVFAGKIANRLVQEGARRQTIIFTHNIAFLMELLDSAEELAKGGTVVPIVVHTLRRKGRKAGVTTSGAPWYALKVAQRAHYLDQLINEAKSLYEKEPDQYNSKVSHVYGLLREAWESCVEDDLLLSVVCRYRNSVHTQRLLQVEIQDPDVHFIDEQMSKASKWMVGHDKSKGLDHNRPSPMEATADINELRLFAKKLAERRKSTEERRKGQRRIPT